MADRPEPLHKPVSTEYESSGESVPLGSPSDLPMAALAAWNELPATIKDDPYLAPFRKGYEKHMRDAIVHSHPMGTLDEEPCEAGNSREVESCVVSTSNSASKTKSGNHCENICGTWWIRHLKIFCLVAVWIFFTMVLMIKSEKVSNVYQITVPPHRTKSYWILEKPRQHHLGVSLTGAFLPKYYRNLSTNALTVQVQLVQYRHKDSLLRNVSTFKKTYVSLVENISEKWSVPLVSSEELVESVPKVTLENVFDIKYKQYSDIHSVLRLQLSSNIEANVPVAIGYDLTPIDTHGGVIWAAVVLCSLYVLIVFEIVHRTLAAMMASTMSIAILAYYDERPAMTELVSWINVETLLLLFSMMVLVAIFAETGIFDYLSVYAYKVTGTDIWPLVNILCFFTVVLSSFLDNVTTMLLMTPVTIRLCEVKKLNPVPVLMAVMMFSNVGGALTPVGDPPNVIIASNSDVQKADIDFGTFTLHMGAGLIFIMFALYLQLRFIFRNTNDFHYADPQQVQELKHEIGVWQRAAASLTPYSKDEGLVRKALMSRVKQLATDLDICLCSSNPPREDHASNVKELQEQYPIRDKELLWKSGVTMVLVITLFFLHSTPTLKLSLGWTALLGAMLLLVLADNEDMEGVLARVEWGTLIFFAALFVLMEALSRLGLIDWVGQQTEQVILSVSEPGRLAVAIVLILWVSAAMSSLVDNIPLSTMMIKVVTSLARKKELGLPLPPLVWALAFGACLGGNGTLIGSSSNVVCTGVAEQHGYRFTFMQYFKIGMPVTILTVFVANIYLIIAHVVLSWH